ncbi:uncharacterized protein AMSG_03593 [Thecamonas trahens ATCC 50062]|uniref:MYND-type domain-containing protein n=1 Tax=Thecamonas trahens ATCC 50062 TaxID=461836 RepID=A0A0L0D4K4_THETB|nr:hypothetical protein AMSG_03593 [Thecamonas trahens ATCC 50062]KNC47165.1 hypothetical protein AMSG_03593 [Thecamonas trahens ATCC 50062]|eukprot:XP_013759939.1 hypothetical protein AMSG_03593 [Thecamonas trahens ATCC 50062]
MDAAIEATLDAAESERPGWCPPAPLLVARARRSCCACAAVLVHPPAAGDGLGTNAGDGGGSQSESSVVPVSQVDPDPVAGTAGGSAGVVVCPGCRLAVYCSRACAVADTARHEPQCARLRHPDQPKVLLATEALLTAAAEADDPDEAMAMLAPLAVAQPDNPSVMVGYAEAMLAALRRDRAIGAPSWRTAGRKQAALALLRDVANMPSAAGRDMAVLAHIVHAEANEPDVSPPVRRDLLQEAHAHYRAAQSNAVPLDDPHMLLDMVSVVRALVDAGPPPQRKSDLLFELLTTALDTLELPAVAALDDRDPLPATLHCMYARALVEYDAFRSSMLMGTVNNDLDSSGASGPRLQPKVKASSGSTYLASRQENERAERLHWGASDSVFDATIPHLEIVLDSSHRGDHLACCGVALLRAYGKANKYSRGAELAHELLTSPVAEYSAPLHLYAARIFVSGFADMDGAARHFQRAVELAQPDFAIRANFGYASFLAHNAGDAEAAGVAFGKVLSLQAVAPNDPTIRAQVRNVELPQLRRLSLVSNVGLQPDDGTAGVGVGVALS